MVTAHRRHERVRERQTGRDRKSCPERTREADSLAAEPLGVGGVDER